MRSLLGGVANKIETGWSNTTYNRPISIGKKNSDAEKLMGTYASVSTLFSVVGLIANATGSTKWRMYRTRTDERKVKGPNEIDRHEVVKHLALDLWDKPNPFYTCSRLVESYQQHIDLTGMGYLVVARNAMSSMPLELWPVRPDKIEPVPSEEDFLLGYIYNGPNGEKIPLDVEDVISTIMPNPLDPYTGLGPVQALLTDLDAVKYAAMFNLKFFQNDASPGGVIEIDQRLSDQEWYEFTERWRAGHQGVSNAHRVATLENGAKWKDTQYTMRDMQFSELRNISREIIREAFRVHPHMLGLTEDINRANAEAAEDVFARWVIKPRLDRIKDSLNNQLLPLFGSSSQGIEFDFDDPSLEDSEATNAATLSKAQAAKVLIEAGGEFVSVLEAMGLPEIEFDQAKIDREDAAKKEAAKALQNGQGNSSDGIASDSPGQKVDQTKQHSSSGEGKAA